MGGFSAPTAGGGAKPKKQANSQVTNLRDDPRSSLPTVMMVKDNQESGMPGMIRIGGGDGDAPPMQAASFTGGGGGGFGGGGDFYSSEPGTAKGGRVGTLMPSAAGWKVDPAEQAAARAKNPNATAGVRPPGYSSSGAGGGGAGGAGGGGGGTATPPAVPGSGIPLTNVAENSPDLAWIRDKYKSRFDQDNTKRAIDRSNLGIADAAALMAADQRGGLAARGALDTGAGASFLNKRVFAPAQRQAAQAAADISMGRERDLDQLTLQGLPIMRAGDEMNLANRGLGLQQYGLQQQGALQQQQMALERERMEQQRRDTELSRWLALMGGGGGF